MNSTVGSRATNNYYSQCDITKSGLTVATVYSDVVSSFQVKIPINTYPCSSCLRMSQRSV